MWQYFTISSVLAGTVSWHFSLYILKTKNLNGLAHPFRSIHRLCYMLEYESAVYASNADSWGQSSGGRARVGSQSCEMWMLRQKRLELGCGASEERSFHIASAGLSSNALQDNGHKCRTELCCGVVGYSVIQHRFQTSFMKDKARSIRKLC